MAKRLLVCDFDGTIDLKNNRRHMGEVMNVLDHLAEDVVFAVASGRPLHLLLPYFKDCYIISNDGALITYGNRILYSNPIHKEEISEFCNNREWVAHGGCISYLHTNSRARLSSWRKTYDNHVVRVSDLSHVEEDIYKIFFTDKVSPPDGLKQCYASYGIMEYTSTNTDKGIAVATLSQLLNIDKEHITAFGDGENDIPMFKTAGRSFASANSSPKVRAAADMIYTSLKERLLEYEKF